MLPVYELTVSFALLSARSVRQEHSGPLPYAPTLSLGRRGAKGRRRDFVAWEAHDARRKSIDG